MLAKDFTDKDGFFAAVGVGDKGREAFKGEVGLALGIGAHGYAQQVDVMYGGEIVAEVVMDKAVFRLVVAVDHAENVN